MLLAACEGEFAGPTRQSAEVVGAANSTEAPADDGTQNLTIADLPSYEPPSGAGAGIRRRIDLHTVIPERPRLEVLTYQVRPGEPLFGIAENYGLTPETILWGNFDVLGDNPHSLRPDQACR